MLVEAVNWKDPSKPTLVLLLLSKDPVEEEFGCCFPILPTTELLKVLEALLLTISFFPWIDELDRVRTITPHDLIDCNRRSRRSSMQCDCPTSGAIDDRCSPIWALSSLTLSLIWALSSLSLSLSLSLFFWKWFEGKMKVQNHFRVKGENIGQPEVIFRKISFSVTAKHADLGENDFLKSFSPKTNAP